MHDNSQLFGETGGANDLVVIWDCPECQRNGRGSLDGVGRLNRAHAETRGTGGNFPFRCISRAIQGSDTPAKGAGSLRITKDARLSCSADCVSCQAAGRGHVLKESAARKGV